MTLNPVYLRMILYVAGPLAALIPGVDYNADIGSMGTFTVDVAEVLVTVPTTIAAISAVFAKWGKK